MKEYVVTSPTGGEMVVQLEDDVAKEQNAKLHDGSIDAEFHARVEANQGSTKQAVDPDNKARAEATVKNK